MIYLLGSLLFVFIVLTIYAATRIGKLESEIRALKLHIQYEKQRHKTMNEILGVKDMFTGDIEVIDESK